MEGVSFSSPDHRKMQSSPGVEGALPSSLAIQVGQQSKRKEKGKQKMHEEGPTKGKDSDLILIEEDVMGLSVQDSRIKEMIIKEKEVEIQNLSINLEREKWIINYLK